MRKIYLVSNIVFFPFEDNSGKNVRYVKGSISGDLFLNNIWSEQEILNEYPDAKICKNLHEVIKTWGNKV